MATKSDQIRLLAKEGLTVRQIADRVGVRYQHAYNVLNQAALIAARVRQPPSAAAPKAALMISDLVGAGFVRAAGWHLIDNLLALDSPMTKEVGVYAFVIDGEVQYVGVATTGLKGRLYGYSRPGRGQKTNIRINEIIRARLELAHHVEVFVATPEPAQWNGLPVDTCAGLELGLIKKYSLPWNVRSSG